MTTIVYKVPGPNRGPKGTTYSWRSADIGSKLPDGWHGTLVGAVDSFLGVDDKPKRKRRTKEEMEADKADDS